MAAPGVLSGTGAPAASPDLRDAREPRGLHDRTQDTDDDPTLVTLYPDHVGVRRLAHLHLPFPLGTESTHV